MGRLLDSAGVAWPDYPTSCPRCGLPADPSLDGGPHPSCTPPSAPVDPATHAGAVALVENLLAAEQIDYSTDWLVSGQPVGSPANGQEPS